jgi:hypothetical protein
MPPEPAPLFHVIDPRVFDRAQLDDLCDLTNRVRFLAKHPDGARFLLGLSINQADLNTANENSLAFAA